MERRCEGAKVQCDGAKVRCGGAKVSRATQFWRLVTPDVHQTAERSDPRT